MAHQPSSGAPYSDPGNPADLFFSVSGEPQKVQEIGGAKTEGTEPDEGDAALAELGASIKKKTRSASVTRQGRAALPNDPEALAKSPYNRAGA